MRFSIVIPAHNEAENLPALVAEAIAATVGHPLAAILLVDDGSSDATATCLAPQISAGAPIRVLRHDRRRGLSAAILTGVRNADTPWVVTMDGDGENDPADIPALLRRRDQENPQPALVGGLRRRRRASWSKRVASRFANRLRGWLLRDGCPDTGCGLKLFRRDAFLALPNFDGMHRFLPALFRMHGHKAVYVEVNDRMRRHGRSHFGNLDRGLRGAADLIGVMWLIRRRMPPPGTDSTRDEKP